MSLAQLCDLAYYCLWEEAVATVRMAQQVWMGSDGKTPPPTVEEAVQRLDEALERDAWAGLTVEALEERMVLGVLK